MWDILDLLYVPLTAVCVHGSQNQPGIRFILNDQRPVLLAFSVWHR